MNRFVNIASNNVKIFDLLNRIESPKTGGVVSALPGGAERHETHAKNQLSQAQIVRPLPVLCMSPDHGTAGRSRLRWARDTVPSLRSQKGDLRNQKVYITDGYKVEVDAGINESQEPKPRMVSRRSLV